MLRRSNVVVVTKCPTASANPETAVHPAAISWARRPPPISRATSAASTVVAAAASADGSRRPEQRPRAERVHRVAEQRHQRRLIRIARRRMRPGHDEVQLVPVKAIPSTRRKKHRNLHTRHQPHRSRKKTAPLRTEITPSTTATLRGWSRQSPFGWTPGPLRGLLASPGRAYGRHERRPCRRARSASCRRRRRRQCARQPFLPVGRSG